MRINSKNTRRGFATRGSGMRNIAVTPAQCIDQVSAFELAHHLVLQLLKRPIGGHNANQAGIVCIRLRVVRQRQVVRIDRPGELHAGKVKVLDAVLQLWHMAGPVVGEQPSHGTLGEHWAWQLVGLGVAHAEDLQQERDVIAALKQGWHLDRDYP